MDIAFYMSIIILIIIVFGLHPNLFEKIKKTMSYLTINVFGVIIVLIFIGITKSYLDIYKMRTKNGTFRGEDGNNSKFNDMYIVGLDKLNFI